MAPTSMIKSSGTMVPLRARLAAWLPLLVPLALLLIALGLRLYRLEAQSLWLDEGSSWALSRAPWRVLLVDLIRPSAAYPLYHLLLKGWMALFGDSETALRMPSALAGALAVPVSYLAALELRRLTLASSSLLPAPSAVNWSGLATALLMTVSPYAIWYSQEAKVYSLLLLSSALLVWAVARVARTLAWRDWIVLAGLALFSLLIHRLSALLLVAAAFVLTTRLILAQPRRPWLALALPGLLAVGLVAAMVGGLGGEQAAGRAAAGAAIPAGPGLALGLTFVRFSLDRWPGDLPGWWLWPWLGLAAWGLFAVLRELTVTATRPRAAFLLTMLVVPLLLFLAQLRFTQLYEARYLTVIFPLWVLWLSYPLIGWQERGLTTSGARLAVPGYAVLLVIALSTSGLALRQPVFGLFSGDPVKEQYRTIIGELAARVHPDDAIVIHPAYLRPLYDYYMGRLSSDPAPEPLLFPDFWQGETSYGQREWDLERRTRLAGFTRSFLLIAPDHARTVDRPLPGDEYGLVGNFWRFSREQGTWPCGIWRANGIHLLCQAAPEAYTTGAIQTPVTLLEATFGSQIQLLGITMKATTPAGPGVYRAGGNLPLSLFWEVTTPVANDYSLFLHLCQDCERPPLASEDGPPLEGYLPTSSWLPGKPARDDRAISLPRDLPPGQYTLLLGLYDPNDPTPAGRLAIIGGTTLGNDRLVLGTVEIIAP